MKLNQLTSPSVIILLIIIYPLLFIWQGLDFYDTGYFLTGDQQAFNEPESASYDYHNWLAVIIGAIWIQLFGDSLGLLGANLFGVITVYITIVFSYLILKPYIEKKYLLIFLLVTTIFTKWIYLIDYNNLTCLFYTASAFFLIDGLRKEKYLTITTAGFILGLNLFVRLSNIPGLLLIITIFFYGYISRIKYKIQFTQILCFLSGYIFAISLTIFAMKIIGHYDLYIDSVKSLFNSSLIVGTHHNLELLIERYVKDDIKVFVLLILFVSFMLIISKFFSRVKVRWLYYGFLVILIFAYALMLIIGYIVFHKHPSYDLARFFVLIFIGLSYVILLLYISNIEKSSNHFRLVCFVAFIIIFIMPLGSNIGLRKAIFGTWIPIPILLMYISGLKEINFGTRTASNSFLSKLKFRLNQNETHIFKITIITCLVAFSLESSFLQTHQDSWNRFEMRYSIRNPRLKGTFTREYTAKVVQELLDELDHYVKEDDYLLVTTATIIYFLTKTKPYINSSDTMNNCNAPELKQKLKKAIEERPYLPVIVAIEGTSKSKDEKTQAQIMREFIEQNGYSVVWSNNEFEILVPPEKKI